MLDLRERIETILEYVYSCNVKSDKGNKDKVMSRATAQILQMFDIKEFEDLVKKVRAYAGIGGKQFNQDEKEFWAMCEANDKAEVCFAQIKEEIWEK